MNLETNQDSDCDPVLNSPLKRPRSDSSSSFDDQQPTTRRRLAVLPDDEEQAAHNQPGILINNNDCDDSNADEEDDESETSDSEQSETGHFFADNAACEDNTVESDGSDEEDGDIEGNNEEEEEDLSQPQNQGDEPPHLEQVFWSTILFSDKSQHNIGDNDGHSLSEHNDDDTTSTTSLPRSICLMRIEVVNDNSLTVADAVYAFTRGSDRLQSEQHVADFDEANNLEASWGHQLGQFLSVQPKLRCKILARELAHDPHMLALPFGVRVELPVSDTGAFPFANLAETPDIELNQSAHAFCRNALQKVFGVFAPNAKPFFVARSVVRNKLAAIQTHRFRSLDAGAVVVCDYRFPQFLVSNDQANFLAQVLNPVLKSASNSVASGVGVRAFATNMATTQVLFGAQSSALVSNAEFEFIHVGTLKSDHHSDWLIARALTCKSIVQVNDLLLPIGPPSAAEAPPLSFQLQKLKQWELMLKTAREAGCEDALEDAANFSLEALEVSRGQVLRRAALDAALLSLLCCGGAWRVRSILLKGGAEDQSGIILLTMEAAAQMLGCLPIQASENVAKDVGQKAGEPNASSDFLEPDITLGADDGYSNAIMNMTRERLIEHRRKVFADQDKDPMSAPQYGQLRWLMLKQILVRLRQHIVKLSFLDWKRVGLSILNESQRRCLDADTTRRDAIDLFVAMSFCVEDAAHASQSVVKAAGYMHSGFNSGTSPCYHGDLLLVFDLWREHDPKAAKLWKDSLVESAALLVLKDAKNHGHEAPARLYFALFWDCILTSFGSSGRGSVNWHKFNGRTWQPLEDAINLISDLKGKVADVAPPQEHPEVQAEDFDEDHDGMLPRRRGQPRAKQQNFKKQPTQQQEFEKDICHDPFRRSVLRMAGDMLNMPRWDELKDYNKELFVTTTVSIELSTRTPHLRRGRPSDLATINSGVGYKNLGHNHPDVVTMTEMMSQMWGYNRPDVVSTVMHVMSSCLQEGNRLKKFFVCHGHSNSGKSGFVNILGHALGTYHIGAKSDMITVGKEQNAEAPESTLMMCRQKRAVSYQETSSEKKLNSAMIKSLTGDDERTGRELHQTAKTFRLGFMPMLWQNGINALSETDSGMWTRMMVCKTVGVFEFHAPKDRDEQIRQKCYTRDPLFNRRYQDLGVALLWLMVDNWPAFWDAREKDTIVCQTVQDYTTQYLASTDQVVDFFTSCLTHNADRNSTIDEATLFDVYKKWYEKKASVPNSTMKAKLQRDKFVHNFENFARRSNIDDTGSAGVWREYRFTRKAESLLLGVDVDPLIYFAF